MNKLRQSLRRKKPTYVPEASRPHQWGADEEAVRRGKCSFPVRYLGHVEVEESRGMHVCEDAVKKLKLLGKKSVKAILWVSADGLRVVDDKTKDLIVDQTIEKVSFCAPDRNFDKAFSYICRDGTTRRWICHCFMALKDSGERLSHAVGCAFAACLERKQKREKECGVTASFDASRTSFAREGSFRVTSATQQAEREEVVRQVQEKKKAEVAQNQPLNAVPVAAPPNPVLPAPLENSPALQGVSVPAEKGEAGSQHAIPRRHAPLEQLVRQGSFRGFPALSQKNSPFKRQLSLRLNELPSTLQRKTNFQDKGQVPELDPTGPPDPDGIGDLCNQINNSFTNHPSEDTFVNGNGTRTPPHVPALPPPRQTAQSITGWPDQAVSTSTPSHFHMGHRRTPSEAERWLEEVANAAKAQQQQQQQQQEPVPQPMVAVPMAVPAAIQAYPVSYDASPAPVGIFIAPHMQPAYIPVGGYNPSMANSMSYPTPSVPVVGITPSQMVANAFCSATQVLSSNLASKSNPFPQSILHSSTTNIQNPSQSVQSKPKPNGTANGTWPPDPSQLRLASTAQEVDQFEAQWAALESKSQQRMAKPFSNELQKTFQIEL